MAHRERSATHRLSSVPGFTLVETILAVGLIVAILAITGPALLERIAPMTFDETLVRFEAELRLAREDARRTGQMRLIYVESAERAGGDPGVPDVGVTRVLSMTTPPESDAMALAPASAGSGDGSFGAEPAERPRLVLELPEGYRVVHERPAFLSDQDPLEFEEPTGDALGHEAPFGPRVAQDEIRLEGIGGVDASPGLVLIAVCVPDGTVLGARPTWVTDPDQRASRLRIESASGLIRFMTERRPDAYSADPANSIEAGDASPPEQLYSDPAPGDRGMP